MDDERRPLLLHRSHSTDKPLPADLHPSNPHAQFCHLAGITPSNLPAGTPWPKAARTSIYQRAKRKEGSQQRTYLFTAALTNTLLLSQIVIGAALTALGASGSPSIYVAVFGALNTVIAGLVTYLKSRGQPMRARMFRDDLERVVDQIENSETMWLGIATGVLGYDEIDIDDEVSVRSEVARLTRLYDKAVRNNTFNNPDMYLNGFAGSQDATNGLRARPVAVAAPAPVDTAAATTTTATAAAAAAVPAPAPAPGPDPDEAPATKPKIPDPVTTAAAPTPATPAASGSAPAPNDGQGATGSTTPTATDAPSTSAPTAPTTTTTPAADTAPPANSAPALAPAASTNANVNANVNAPVPLAADIDEGPVTGDVDDDNKKTTSKKGS